MTERIIRWGILGAANIAKKNWEAIRHSGNGMLTAVALLLQRGGLGIFSMGYLPFRVNVLATTSAPLALTTTLFWTSCQEALMVSESPSQ